MEKIEKVDEIIETLSGTEFQNKSIGLVPTMGALHNGHLELCRHSILDNDLTVVSIFVNQTQFNNSDDYQSYPHQIEEDLEKLKKMGVSYAFCPNYSELYPEDYRFKMSESDESQILCGAHRPGHFDGVLSVVLKLFQITQATRAYFGEKDFQQLRLIQQMAKSYFLKTDVIGVPTLREKDGLAMSSRNLNLNSSERALAPELYTTLKDSQFNCFQVKEALEKKGFKVDYVEEHWGRRFVAASLGSVRLIDNIAL